MPPIRKYDREIIIESALELVRLEGMRSLNARRLATNLGCSVQPIFHNFKNMEELVDEVMKKISLKYHEYMRASHVGEKAYKSLGLSYIKFASDFPEFFRLLFMNETSFTAESFIMQDEISDDIIKAGQELTGFSYEDQKKFHVQVWIFTHGIACLVATKTVLFQEQEIGYLLEHTVRSMMLGELEMEKEQ